VPAGIPCEIQIKTILQHAYSELTHDTIYKPQINATPNMQRSAAKAMALLEATNDYFEKVAGDVNAALASVRSITAQLGELYQRAVGVDPKPSLLEGLLLEAYEASAPEDYLDRVAGLLRDKPFLIDRIRDHVAHRSPLFLQPSVLLVYLAIDTSLRTATRVWPRTPEELEPLLNDFGESLH
jgi:putative GTP pyrophosphokinase